MSTIADHHIAAEAGPPTHPRDRSFASWRARLGLLASRGVTDGPEVAEARAALDWHRNRSALMKMGFADATAADLADQAAKTAVTA